MSVTNQQIELADSNNIVRVRLGIDSDNHPYLSLNDSCGLERVILVLDEDGNGKMNFRSGEGQPLLAFGVSTEHGAGMSILDFEGDARLAFEVIDGIGRIELDSKQGSYTWPPSGTADFRLSDRPGQ